MNEEEEEKLIFYLFRILKKKEKIHFIDITIIKKSLKKRNEF